MLENGYSVATLRAGLNRLMFERLDLADHRTVVRRGKGFNVDAAELEIAAPLGNEEGNDRAFQAGAAGAGADGSPEHRQVVRCRGDTAWPAVLRHGTGARNPNHGLLRPE